MKRLIHPKEFSAPRQMQVFKARDMGAMLRARRKDLGYTQEEVAELMGCSPRLVGEMEKGRPGVGVQRMLDYATGLGIDVLLLGRW